MLGMSVTNVLVSAESKDFPPLGTLADLSEKPFAIYSMRKVIPNFWKTPLKIRNSILEVVKIEFDVESEGDDTYSISDTLVTDWTVHEWEDQLGALTMHTVKRPFLCSAPKNVNGKNLMAIHFERDQYLETNRAFVRPVKIITLFPVGTAQVFIEDNFVKIMDGWLAELIIFSTDKPLKEEEVKQVQKLQKAYWGDLYERV